MGPQRAHPDELEDDPGWKRKPPASSARPREGARARRSRSRVVKLSHRDVNIRRFFFLQECHNKWYPSRRTPRAEVVRAMVWCCGRRWSIHQHLRAKIKHFHPCSWVVGGQSKVMCFEMPTHDWKLQPPGYGAGGGEELILRV